MVVPDPEERRRSGLWTGFEGELGCTSGVDGDGLREDVDDDDVAGFVGAVSGGTDGLDCWRSAVDDESAVTSEGIAAVKGRECECGVVACGVWMVPPLRAREEVAL